MCKYKCDYIFMYKINFFVINTKCCINNIIIIFLYCYYCYYNSITLLYVCRYSSATSNISFTSLRHTGHAFHRIAHNLHNTLCLHGHSIIVGYRHAQITHPSRLLDNSSRTRCRQSFKSFYKVRNMFSLMLAND